jgi:hypothetical protein
MSLQVSVLSYRDCICCSYIVPQFIPLRANNPAIVHTSTRPVCIHYIVHIRSSRLVESTTIGLTGRAFSSKDKIAFTRSGGNEDRIPAVRCLETRSAAIIPARNVVRSLYISEVGVCEGIVVVSIVATADAWPEAVVLAGSVSGGDRSKRNGACSVRCSACNRCG